MNETTSKQSGFVNRLGQRSGKLIVTSLDKRKGATYWLCQCDCGNVCSVRSDRLKPGRTQSCGCLKPKYDPTPRVRNCNRCDTPKQFPDDFPLISHHGEVSKPGGTCKDCVTITKRASYERNRKETNERMKTIRRNRRIKNMQLVVNYLKEHPCVDCGEGDWIVLQFDHVRGVKKFTVSNKIGHASWKTLQAEIDKCDVRCANCHTRKTIKENDWMAYIQ